MFCERWDSCFRRNDKRHMPELPEVETIANQLDKLLKNKVIASVELRLPKQVKSDRKKFLKLVTGAKIKQVFRRAKILIMDLDNDYYLMFHLKLTGQLIYRDKKGALAGSGHPDRQNLKELPNRHSHIIFNFKNGGRLFFNDLRQFGWVKLVSAVELKNILQEFGPEPLANDFSFKKFYDIFAHKKTAIKPLLMEQKFLAGVGNIYATEACFCAGILPTRQAHKISEAEYKNLYQCLRKVLKFAISKKGSSAENYLDAFGAEGLMTKYLKVYGRAGEKCRKCGGTIKFIKQGSRTSFYCLKCQH